MKHSYDWSKLDAGWRFDAAHSRFRNGTLVLVCHDLNYDVDTTAASQYPPCVGRGNWTLFYQSARAQLAKCRIPAPDMATVTELRPRDEYDWSRLEGSGWFVEGDTITNREFVYMFTRNDHRLRCDDGCFDAESAMVAQQEAERLVAKCRRDWRDEVKQACEGIDGLAELYLMRPTEYRLRSSDSPHWFALSFNSDRTIGLIDGVQTLEWVLKLSIIIERLKKLGWREA